MCCVLAHASLFLRCGLLLFALLDAMCCLCLYRVVWLYVFKLMLCVFCFGVDWLCSCLVVVVCSCLICVLLCLLGVDLCLYVCVCVC